MRSLHLLSFSTRLPVRDSHFWLLGTANKTLGRFALECTLGPCASLVCRQETLFRYLLVNFRMSLVGNCDEFDARN